MAKFITADIAQSALTMADDGQLPELHLESADRKKKKPVAEATQQWRLVALVTVSLTLSALMLLGDFKKESSRETPADLARAKIKTTYIGDDQEELQPYQIFLREALVAHSRGDSKTEQRYYRKVLRLLRAENHEIDPDEKGVTGQRKKSSNDPTLRTDEGLLELLSILLRGR